MSSVGTRSNAQDVDNVCDEVCDEGLVLGESIRRNVQTPAPTSSRPGVNETRRERRSSAGGLQIRDTADLEVRATTQEVP